MASENITGFTRDPALAADIADQFGGGGARAESLIAAVQARESEELRAANLLVEDVDARGDYSPKDVDDVLDLPSGSVKGVTKRGEFLTYVFVDATGRSGKGALRIEDGELVQPEETDTPELASLRAQAESAGLLRSAQKEAEAIIEKARAKAAELVKEAAEDAQEKRAEGVAKAVEAQQAAEEPTPARKPARKPAAKD